MLCADFSPPPGIICCEPRKPQGAREWWSFREIKSARCWYAGRPGKPKSELRWCVRRTPPSEAAPEIEKDLESAPAVVKASCWNDARVDIGVGGPAVTTNVFLIAVDVQKIAIDYRKALLKTHRARRNGANHKRGMRVSGTRRPIMPPQCKPEREERA